VAWTPNVSGGSKVGAPVCEQRWFGAAEPCLSEVYSTAEVNGEVIVVGAFTKACLPGTLAQGLCKPGTQVTRDDIFAYQAATGKIDPHFAPKLDMGPVFSVIPGPKRSDTVYVGGAFHAVNGQKHKGVVQLYVHPRITRGSGADGSDVTGFKAQVSNYVKALELSPDGKALYLGGQFLSVDTKPRAGLARVSAATGAIDRKFFFLLSRPAGRGPHQGHGDGHVAERRAASGGERCAGHRRQVQAAARADRDRRDAGRHSQAHQLHRSGPHQQLPQAA
jgi:hypothetical protein